MVHSLGHRQASVLLVKVIPSEAETAPKVAFICFGTSVLQAATCG